MSSDADGDGELDDDYLHQQEQQQPSFKIRIPRLMARSVTDNSMSVRRSSRHRGSSTSFAQPSGSEYSVGDASISSPTDERPSRKKKSRVVHDDYGPDDYEGEFTQKVEVKEYTTSHGRSTKRPNYLESDDDKASNLFELAEDQVEVVHKRSSRSTRSNGVRGGGHARVNSDDEGEVSIAAPIRMTRSRSKKTSESPPADTTGDVDVVDDAASPSTSRRITRSRASRLRKSARQIAEEDGYTEVGDADVPGSSEDELMDEAPSTPVNDDDNDDDNDDGPRTYTLRARTKQVNYAIPPPIEEMVRPPKAPSGRANKGKGRVGPGWSANGTVLSRYMGMPGPADDSDSDAPTRTPRKPFGAGAGAGGGMFAAGGGGLFPDGLAAAGTPSNLGKVSDAALADADPLGVNTNVTFEEVGGLDDHINSLKEMTLLPLLYPEVFQRFNLVPPRGVLFHGPPGTGKTLLARALAASCRSNGKGISFFMRKGADVLSKWVGEAERQLRLLFEEARNQQPSIIFFDEIDGLAPVRSSKQDQIHASMVSTLLALMDGMDGRGQVVVIGATNRPDAVDPALRRPGRFDREFYFPLPNVEARAKILSINTRKWEGWDDEKAKETIQKLAKITKGYGGADLRALCTEAALNAVQRRYPQIYKSNDRLLLKPETIGVQARDFMISVKKLVPSSARSTGSSATPLPSQLVPLLDDTLQRVKAVLEKAVPLGKKRTALEEAEFEDEDDEGALEREILMQKMETLRVYRPRVVLHGESGMGQSYIGAAALHHLEGYHIQTLDLGSLMGDSTRTVEAGVVQLFVEAKRHQPSVIYVPSLHGWCAAVSETVRTTVKAMLDTLSPSDPILLLAVVDGPFSSLPRDVRLWFGMNKENRVVFTYPDADKRRKFFDELLDDIRRPPNQFPDGIKRKKRVHEELPIAPPLEPRQPSAAELALQEENDQRILTLLKFRLGPILAELKRKHKRFTKPARDEYNLYPDQNWDPFLGPTYAPVTAEASGSGLAQPNGVIVIDGNDTQAAQINGTHVAQPPAEPQLYEVDLESMNADLYKGKFLTPSMFLEEIRKMVYNADVRQHEDRDRLNKAQAMYTAAEVSIQEFDPGFRLECERMAGRERKRREQRRAEKRKSQAGSREDSVTGNGSGAETAVRRSGRNNGQKLDLAITDPLLLERRLKRARSRDANGDGDVIGGSGEDSGEDRDSKRSKLDAIMEDPDHDELDLVGPNSSQARPASVRFAPLGEDLTQTPTKVNLNNLNGFGHGQLIPQPTLESIAEVQSEQRHYGFDPSLLNPSSIEQEPLPSVASLIASNSSQSDLNAPPSLYLPDQQPFSQYISTPSYDPQNQPPMMPENLYVSPAPPNRFFPLDPTLEPVPPPLLQPTPVYSPTPVPAPIIEGQEQAPATTEAEQHPAPSPSAMEVEAPAPVPRSPSPPPPTFHVDETLLSSLEDAFIAQTDRLNVEQLEQLRATALNCIWRHRQEWDRDSCVKELFGAIEEFVGEVREFEGEGDFD